MTGTDLRHTIRMTDAEASAFLDCGHTLICATNGPHGRPHMMPLWYTLRDGEPWGWTYAKSQKARNLERDPRATVEVEAGETYFELRGIMLECDVVIHRDPGLVLTVGTELAARYPDPGDTPEVLRRMAAKRVALQFVERRRVTWDHRKLEH
jgi:PPOX class probable F420-dependent enzyme